MANANADITCETPNNNNRTVPLPSPVSNIPFRGSNTYMNLLATVFTSLSPRPLFRSLFRLIRNPLFIFQFVFRTISKVATYFLNSYFRTNDPIRDVREFTANFNRQYSDSHYEFYSGTYGEALNKAKTEVRFLLVYLHSPSHLNTDSFCRDTLCSDLVTCTLTQYNVILWGVSVRSLEGMRVGRIMHENTYPFLALILSHNQHMEVVHRFEGYQGQEVFVERLRVVLEQQENLLVVTRNEIETRVQNRLLRDEQDREYQDSMVADMERMRKQEEEKERKLREEEESNKRREEAILKRENSERRKSELVRFFSENQTDSSEQDSIEIRFKFPNAKPDSNLFLQEHNVSRLYDFIFSSQNSPENFQIAMNFPRKVLDLKTFGDLTLRDVGITKSCTLFVEDLDS